MTGGACRRALQGLRVVGRVVARVVALPGCEPRRAASGPGAMNVFNRAMKRRQKNWAAALEDGQQYDYLRDEVRVHVSTHLRYLY